MTLKASDLFMIIPYIDEYNVMNKYNKMQDHIKSDYQNILGIGDKVIF